MALLIFIYRMSKQKMDYNRRVAYSPFLADEGKGVIDSTPIYAIIVASLVVLSIILLSIAIWQTVRRFPSPPGSSKEPVLPVVIGGDTPSDGLSGLAIAAIVLVPLLSILAFFVFTGKIKRVNKYMPEIYKKPKSMLFRNTEMNQNDNDLEPVG